MNVPVKLLGFVVWLLCLKCGQCKDCLRDDITYENVEPVSEASYADGKTVKVTCETGYTGMYRLKCENGKWSENIARPCAKKKCSHPGDAANADFKLLDGTEFVFGTTVVHTCKKGYEMTSRINQRTCRSQGWDNAIPECEAVKCPAIRTDREVIASGNTEEGNYGEVIHFECASSEKKIDGSRDIHCTEKGDWSAPVPNCIEITCTAPDLLNGEFIDLMPVYQKDATLKYRCNQGYKIRDAFPRCASHGWTLNPECDVVTCELTSNYEVKKVVPEGKTIFKAGERVTITCTEKTWFRSKETSRTFTCQDDGQWDSNPVCEVITCEPPSRDQHVSTSFWRTWKLDESKYYECVWGYYKKAEEATCTRDGLTPKPLCVEIVCASPDLPNAKITRGQESKYKLNAAIEYKCHPGFEPQGTVQITCISSGQWSGIQKCTGMCGRPDIRNAKIEGALRQSYSTASTLQYKCNPGFEPEETVEITCNPQAQWTGLQQCTEKQDCDSLHVKNGFSQPLNKKEVLYSCNEGYKPLTGEWWSSVTCSKGSDAPLCIREEECGDLPSVQNGKLKLKDQKTAEVDCDPGFISDPPSIKCIRGTWETPTCNAGVRCSTPPKVVNALITSKPKLFYIDKSIVTYACRSPFTMKGQSTVSCLNGKWEETPICEGGDQCDAPPKVENADITSKHEDFYVDGSSVTYACRTPFSMKGESTVFCRFGIWEEPPTCEAKCPRPFENFMELEKDKDEYDNKETLKYKCLKPYNKIPGGEWICENGKWTGDFVCTSDICPPPPYIENGSYNSRNPDDNIPTEVSYKCNSYYVLSGRKEYYRCENGRWETPPKCLKPCVFSQDILEAHNMKLDQRTTFLMHNHYDYYDCKDGWTTANRGYHYMKVTCLDGKSDIKSCQKDTN
ncbi:complement factor H precursor [Danio rerio]|uniref:Complement factor H n=1 Tax=Danio rerio TaxID=7955 RepID=E2FHP4_DANRE|nr:complement factor H precursor [Danio rerio]ADK32771.1 complement factor H [Danio rerio]|eukprot:NP_001186119.1 complement factor H precursor [Danio rerio]